MEERIVFQQDIMKLSGLCRFYISLLERTNFPNSNYRAEKMKAKLKNSSLGELISFAALDKDRGRYTSQLVYSKALTVADAIKLAYKLGANYSKEMH